MTGICDESNLRLVGGDFQREGTIEVCKNGVWGPICSDQWDVPDAAVVCRQLGHPINGKTATIISFYHNNFSCVYTF